MINQTVTTTLGLTLALGFFGLNASAGTYANDFNSDPTADPNFSLRPSAKWVPTGSYNGSGYLKPDR